ncbi:SIR2 family NAD-dependent protein deacylase [Allosphingosinicella deserti]|uniref:SIR2 family NAD-dependent protein deacylase n=1 Tax=Allosphingosinicella deserti TaxID=2116704 RepID=UPI001304F08A|nr:SIR2 family protein [Sphingomonas deserti]
MRQRFIDELNEEGDIEIRTKVWRRSEILEMAGDDVFNGLLVDWVSAQRTNARDQVEEFLSDNGCLDRFKELIHRHRQGAVVPFVGAGMSCASGHRPWGDFLKSLLADARNRVADIEALLAGGRYEDAAQAVHDILGAQVFSQEIRSKLGAHCDKVAGPVQLLPMLFSDHVVTTNLDYVLINVYRLANTPFTNSFVGSALRDAPGRIGNEPHSLLRLHGEAEATHGRVLTTAEYNETYTEKRTLAELIGTIAAGRSFLFLGCSLTEDRTVRALKELNGKAAVGHAPHYAFLPQPADADRLARRGFLAEAGIHPIYYPKGDHDQMVESLLIAMIEGIE